VNFRDISNIFFKFSLDVRQLEEKWEFSFCGYERKQRKEISSLRIWIKFLEIQHLWNLINNFVFKNLFVLRSDVLKLFWAKVNHSRYFFSLSVRSVEEIFSVSKIGSSQNLGAREGGSDPPPLILGSGGGRGYPHPLLLELSLVPIKPWPDPPRQLPRVTTSGLLIGVACN